MRTPMGHPRAGRALSARGVPDSAKPERRAVPALRAAGAFRFVSVFTGDQ